MSLKGNFLQLQNTAMKIKETKEKVFRKKMLYDPSYLDCASSNILDKLIDETILDVVTECHRSIKLGYSDFTCPLNEENFPESKHDEKQKLEDENEKKFEEIKCPNCARAKKPSKFATHLGSCMGMGRTSSRIASQRIANINKDISYANIATDDEEEEECYTLPEKNKHHKKVDPKRKREKLKKQKIKCDEEFISINKLKSMTSEERLSFLTNNCGSKIDNTGKFCLKSLRCTQHSEEEKSQARKYISLVIIDNISPDNYVEVEELDIPPLRSEVDHLVTLSPADSTSNSSNSSFKKKAK